MRVAIISDIHSNLQALQAVLKDIDRHMVDKVICLGDVVGYGGSPNEVIDLIQQRNISCIMGNHDAAIMDPFVSAYFNPQALLAVERTRELLTKEHKKFLRSRPVWITTSNARYVHGAPPYSFTEYVKKGHSDIPELFNQFIEQVCFVGHTHKPAFIEPGERFSHIESDTIYKLLVNHKYIINPGSVGQPRDGNAMAKYALLWQGASNHATGNPEYFVQYKAVDYDIDGAIKAINEAGMPSHCGERLRSL